MITTYASNGLNIIDARKTVYSETFLNRPLKNGQIKGHKAMW